MIIVRHDGYHVILNRAGEIFASKIKYPFSYILKIKSYESDKKYPRSC